MKFKAILAALMSVFTFSASGLEIGGKLPNLKGKNQDGKEVVLKAAEGDQWMLIFTYPKAMTGGCTKQVCSVRDSFENLQGKKVTVFGMSTDDVASQKKFVDAHKLPYDLISDPKGELAAELGVPVKLGKFAARQAYLFKDGKLVWKDEKGATSTQGEEVLKAIEANK
ncbi:peroxiredoxin [Verrucomicrobiaceae bacterium 227]